MVKQSARLVVVSIAMLALVGCGEMHDRAVEPSAGVDEPSAEPSESAEDELHLVTRDTGWGGPEPGPRTFTLAADSEGCVYLETEDSRFTPIWPAGLTAKGDIDSFDILDDAGELVLSSGEGIQAAGVAYDHEPAIHLSGLECGEAPFFWITGL